MLSSNGIYHDARLEPGYLYVLHKEAINIWITKTNVDSEMHKEHGIHNTWFDRDMYIGHWCFLPGVRIKQLA
jgi:carbonic anhydrase/acetyltransferase-like protein (isoleucine patch superfamily)